MFHLGIPNLIQVYETPITITIPSDIVNRVRKFVAKCDAQYYIENRGAARGKVTHDNETGKLAEFAASIFLKEEFDFPSIEPDLKIYASNEKSWTPDLPYDTLWNGEGHCFPPVHVKSTDRMWGGDWSWTFQLKNKIGTGGKDRLFELTAGVPDHVAFVVVEEDMSIFNRWDRVAHIHAIAHWFKVAPLLRHPALKEHRGFKLCAYLEDLRKSYATTVSGRQDED